MTTIDPLGIAEFQLSYSAKGPFVEETLEDNLRVDVLSAKGSPEKNSVHERIPFLLSNIEIGMYKSVYLNF